MSSGGGSRGFTLVEVIVSLVIFAVLGSMIFTFLSSSLERAHEPVFMVRDLAEAQSEMEELVAEYNNRYVAGLDDWATFVAGLPVGCSDVSGQGGLSPDFEVYQCQFSAGDQTISALFSEIEESP